MHYEYFCSLSVAVKKIESFIGLYNENLKEKKMDLVLFHDALIHLFRITRILSAPRGNALIIGIYGSGKQSLTRLSSFILGFNFFQIKLTRYYF